MHETHPASIAVTQVKNCLIVALGDDLSGGALDEVKRLVLQSIHEKGCRTIIFEFSSLKFIDSAEFNALKTVSKMAMALGAKSIFVGLSPGIVFHLMTADVDTTGVCAALDLNEALERLGITNVASAN